MVYKIGTVLVLGIFIGMLAIVITGIIVQNLNLKTELQNYEITSQIIHVTEPTGQYDTNVQKFEDGDVVCYMRNIEISCVKK